jgi:hypothetical protein
LNKTKQLDTIPSFEKLGEQNGYVFFRRRE